MPVHAPCSPAQSPVPLTCTPVLLAQPEDWSCLKTCAPTPQRRLPRRWTLPCSSGRGSRCVCPPPVPVPCPPGVCPPQLGSPPNPWTIGPREGGSPQHIPPGTPRLRVAQPIAFSRVPVGNCEANNPTYSGRVSRKRNYYLLHFC